MRTETVIKNWYLFDELSEDAKQEAIQNLYDININYEWWEFMYEGAKNIGLNINGFDLGGNRHATGELCFAANEVCQNIFNNYGETCETYKTANNFMNEWQPIFNNYMDENHENYESRDSEDEMQNLEDEFLKDILEDYSIMLQNESDYLMSEEAIIETIKCNEYEFDINGKF